VQTIGIDNFFLTTHDAVQYLTGLQETTVEFVEIREDEQGNTNKEDSDADDGAAVPHTLQDLDEDQDAGTTPTETMMDVESLSLPESEDFSGRDRRHAFWAKLFYRFKSPTPAPEPWRD